MEILAVAAVSAIALVAFAVFAHFIGGKGKPTAEDEEWWRVIK